MSYADLTFYKTTYGGLDPGDDDEITKWLSRAADDINMYCSVLEDFEEEDYTDAEWTALKKANSAQAEYLLNGGDEGISESVKKESTKNYSYEKTDGSGLYGGLCKRAYKYLSVTPFKNPAVRRGGRCDLYPGIY